MQRRLGLALAVVAGLAALTSLAACGDDAPGAAPSGDPTSAPPTSVASEGSSPEPEPEPEPSVEGPSGPRITGKGAVWTLPAGFEILRRGATVTDARDPRRQIYVGYGELAAMGPDVSLSEEAELARETALTDPLPRILDPVTVDGVELYHLAGVGFSGSGLLDQYGARVGNADFFVRIEQEDDVSPARRQQVLDELLAGLDVAG